MAPLGAQPASLPVWSLGQVRSRARGKLATRGTVPGRLAGRHPWGTPSHRGPGSVRAQHPRACGLGKKYTDGRRRRQLAPAPGPPRAQARSVSLTPVHGQFGGSRPPGTEDRAQLTSSLLRGGACPEWAQAQGAQPTRGLSGAVLTSPSHGPLPPCAHSRAHAHALESRKRAHACTLTLPPSVSVGTNVITPLPPCHSADWSTHDTHKKERLSGRSRLCAETPPSFKRSIFTSLRRNV